MKGVLEGSEDESTQIRGVLLEGGSGGRLRDSRDKGGELEPNLLSRLQDWELAHPCDNLGDESGEGGGKVGNCQCSVTKYLC